MNRLRPLLFLPCLLAASPLTAAELPQSAVLEYSSNYRIPAVMTFRRDGQQYRISADINMLLFQIRFESAGRIEGGLLKPRYYREIRNGKTYAEARFDGKRVSYGKTGETQTATVVGTTMDVFTLAWQLAAADGTLPAGISITNGKKIYPPGRLNPLAAPEEGADGGLELNRYQVRQGSRTILYALAPEYRNIPAQIGYDDGEGNGYRLSLTKLILDGQTVWP